MKFKSLDAKMRVFETAHDHCVLPGMHMVARLDGRHFTRLTREKFKFDAPFDVRFRNMMTATVEHLMKCGFQVVYGYTESDEISLLFHRDETAFNRKLRKYDSILAGEASAKFSLLLGDTVSFDCRLCQFPNVDLVCDYFRWRNEDAHRNAMIADPRKKSQGGGFPASRNALPRQGNLAFATWNRFRPSPALANTRHRVVLGDL